MHTINGFMTVYMRATPMLRESIFTRNQITTIKEPDYHNKLERFLKI